MLYLLQKFFIQRKKLQNSVHENAVHGNVVHGTSVYHTNYVKESMQDRISMKIFIIWYIIDKSQAMKILPFCLLTLFSVNCHAKCHAYQSCFHDSMQKQIKIKNNNSTKLNEYIAAKNIYH